MKQVQDDDYLNLSRHADPIAIGFISASNLLIIQAEKILKQVQDDDTST